MTSADEYAQKHIDHIMYEMFNMSLHVRSLSKFLINSDKFLQNIHYLFKEMPFITAVLFLHEVILKTFFPRYRLKAEALEASRHFVECFEKNMAQEELNRNDLLSLQWNVSGDNIKCEINSFGVIKLERKNGDITLIIQDANSRLRMTKDTFKLLCEYKESILYLISFLEANAFVQHQNGQCLAQQ